MNVIIDDREKLPYGLKADKIERKRLLVGDYTLEGLESILTIERKASVAEIAANITNKNFLTEMTRMESFQYGFVVCEFSIDDILSFPRNSGVPKHLWKDLRVNAGYIMRVLTGYMVTFNTKMIFAGNRNNAQRVTATILHQIWEKSSSSDR